MFNNNKLFLIFQNINYITSEIKLITTAGQENLLSTYPLSFDMRAENSTLCNKTQSKFNKKSSNGFKINRPVRFWHYPYQSSELNGCLYNCNEKIHDILFNKSIFLNNYVSAHLLQEGNHFRKSFLGRVLQPKNQELNVSYSTINYVKKNSTPHETEITVVLKQNNLNSVASLIKQDLSAHTVLKNISLNSSRPSVNGTSPKMNFLNKSPHCMKRVPGNVQKTVKLSRRLVSFSPQLDILMQMYSPLTTIAEIAHSELNSFTENPLMEITSYNALGIPCAFYDNNTSNVSTEKYFQKSYPSIHVITARDDANFTGVSSYDVVKKIFADKIASKVRNSKFDYLGKQRIVNLITKLIVQGGNINITQVTLNISSQTPIPNSSSTCKLPMKNIPAITTNPQEGYQQRGMSTIYLNLSPDKHTQFDVQIGLLYPTYSINLYNISSATGAQMRIPPYSQKANKNSSLMSYKHNSRYSRLTVPTDIKLTTPLSLVYPSQGNVSELLKEMIFNIMYPKKIIKEIQPDEAISLTDQIETSSLETLTNYKMNTTPTSSMEIDQDKILESLSEMSSGYVVDAIKETTPQTSEKLITDTSNSNDTGISASINTGKTTPINEIKFSLLDVSLLNPSTDTVDTIEKKIRNHITNETEISLYNVKIPNNRANFTNISGSNIGESANNYINVANSMNGFDITNDNANIYDTRINLVYNDERLTTTVPLTFTTATMIKKWVNNSVNYGTTLPESTCGAAKKITSAPVRHPVGSTCGAAKKITSAPVKHPVGSTRYTDASYSKSKMPKTTSNFAYNSKTRDSGAFLFRNKPTKNTGRTTYDQDFGNMSKLIKELFYNNNTFIGEQRVTSLSDTTENVTLNTTTTQLSDYTRTTNNTKPVAFIQHQNKTTIHRKSPLRCKLNKFLHLITKSLNTCTNNITCTSSPTTIVMDSILDEKQDELLNKLFGTEKTTVDYKRNFLDELWPILSKAQDEPTLKPQRVYHFNVGKSLENAFKEINDTTTEFMLSGNLESGIPFGNNSLPPSGHSQFEVTEKLFDRYNRIKNIMYKKFGITTSLNTTTERPMLTIDNVEPVKSFDDLRSVLYEKFNTTPTPLSIISNDITRNASEYNAFAQAPKSYNRDAIQSAPDAYSFDDVLRALLNNEYIATPVSKNRSYSNGLPKYNKTAGNVKDISEQNKLLKKILNEIEGLKIINALATEPHLAHYAQSILSNLEVKEKVRRQRRRKRSDRFEYNSALQVEAKIFNGQLNFQNAEGNYYSKCGIKNSVDKFKRSKLENDPQHDSIHDSVDTLLYSYIKPRLRIAVDEEKCSMNYKKSKLKDNPHSLDTLLCSYIEPQLGIAVNEKEWSGDKTMNHVKYRCVDPTKKPSEYSSRFEKRHRDSSLKASTPESERTISKAVGDVLELNVSCNKKGTFRTNRNINVIATKQFDCNYRKKNKKFKII